MSVFSFRQSCWNRSVCTALLVAGLILSSPMCSMAQAGASDSDTSPSASKRVRLQPVLRPRESTVRLKPVLRGQPSASKPAPKPASAPEPQPEIASPTTPPSAEPAPAAAAATLAAVPAGGSAVKQPPLPPALKPGEAPPRSAAAARADRRIAAAQALIDKGEIDEARQYLFQLALETHGTPEAARALLLAALAIDDLDQTKQELREIVRAYPNGDVTRTATARLGELNFILGNYEDSLAAYRDLRNMATTEDQRRQADFRIALALQRGGRYSEALQAIEQVARTYPELGKAPEFIEAHAEALMANDKMREAGTRFAELESDFPNYQSAAKVLLNRGLCSELLGDSDAAGRLYSLITEDYPGSLEANLAAARLTDLGVPLIAGAAN